MIKFVDVQPNWTEFINFSERDLGLMNVDSSFCSRILLAIDVQYHVFPVEKLLLNVRLCKRYFWWRHLWRWSIRMKHAKNYETVSKFVKVMARILVASFFPGHCTFVIVGYAVCKLTLWFSISYEHLTDAQKPSSWCLPRLIYDQRLS